MDIQKFLIENLVDTYSNYCECVDGMSSLEFDAQFVDENGKTISDLDFIQERYEEIFIDEVFDALYASIVDFGEVEEIDLEKIVSFLASKYYVFNYKSTPSVISYLKLCNLEDVINLFKTNCDFGMDMIKSYFYSLIDTKRYEDNRKMIYENNDQEKLLDYEKRCVVVNVSTINSILRETICNIYDYYVNLNYDDVEALRYTWMFFIQGFDPTGKIEELSDDEVTKRFYRVYALRLIYSDLYEDVCNKSIIKSENADDRMADLVPLMGIRMRIIGIHANESIRNRMLKHFILLQDEKKKMKENREKTYKEDRVKQLKKVNPFYALDELTF